MDAPGPIPFRPIPFHAAQAYGIRPNGSARPGGAGQTPATGAIVPPRTAGAERVDRISASLSNLVSGSVNSPVSQGVGFEQPTAPRGGTSDGRMQLYTRAADRIEVATDVAIGRTLDTRG